MNNEEINITIKTNAMQVEQEIKKMVPTVNEQLVEISKCLNKIDFGKFINKFQQAFKSIKKNVDIVKNSNIGTQVALNINNENVQKQISQIEKEIESVEKKIAARYNKGMELK